MATTPDLEAFAEEVRYYLRDFPELNRLISGEESSSRMVQYCALLALEEWNARSPVQYTSVKAFPSRGILLQLTIIQLLTSAGILHSRNRLPYNDGGFQADTEAQADEYPKWIQLLRAQVNPLIERLSVRLNIAGAYGGGVPSQYSLLSNWGAWT